MLVCNRVDTTDYWGTCRASGKSGFMSELPPSTAIVCPVTKDASSLHRSAHTFATSAGATRLRMGVQPAPAQSFSKRRAQSLYCAIHATCRLTRTDRCPQRRSPPCRQGLAPVRATGIVLPQRRHVEGRDTSPASKASRWSASIDTPARPKM